MALGKRKREQQSTWVATSDLPKSPGHPFYKGLLNEETALPLLVFPLLGMMCAGQKQLRNFIAHSSTLNDSPAVPHRHCRRLAGFGINRMMSSV